MSFAEKITGLLARPNQQDPVGGPEQPWYLKYGSRLLGIVAAFFAILFGLWNVLSIITLSVSCLVAGIIQMIAGFIVMVLEAPCCFVCIEQVNGIADKVDAKPMYFRAGLYCALAVPPIFMCFGLASLFGSGLIFATGAVYAMMALGKKASAEDMRAAAQQTGYGGNGTAASTTNDRAGIVNNAQPFSFTGAVGTDSNV
ncbi:calcium channel flower isoform X1 [Drosophila miranda]|uniref:Calcium channel flower n=2 Tax=pseudoobscura subgroup TaxID=32358 RepID=FLOWR_DROPE|nr:calcium channel flower isoform X1 [Drosophila pseudoobscura]XP_017138082.1 calcium channel flower isoform X1 [Drosophila miranda]XP_026845596.1 calcium channel flower isoform X1 [Drosophila persimilis]B4GRI8.2 RecName: Full=Calcium channel flower [Drosophila persimilis]